MQRILSYLRKTIENYTMIEEADKIAVRTFWWKRFFCFTNGIKSTAKILSKTF